ncbi:SDR family NAD(P)-dependent oxidoreductase [Niveibacterium sp. SC-1]|uniref:SDR family NAD(P)-dependent oxidoreductase n=1 Tax=Niveibacterium sp. SC-1 TaxID=3135646 RepID=UPI00311F1F4F
MNTPAAPTQLLEGKVALITGANRGIGEAIARLFARHGAQLLLGGRRQEALEAVARGIVEEGGKEPVILAFDVTDPNAVRDAFQRVFKEHRRLDVLVNNAGVLGDALIGMVTEAQIQDTFAVNVFGVIHCAQYAARLMARSGGGSIVNLSSIIGTHGNRGQSVYGGSKAAVIGITQSLAKELAPQNIRCNAIAPGFIDTDMTRTLAPEIHAERMRSIAMGRIGTPTDIANTALFLASDLSAYVTGQVIGVDGGMLI